MSDIVQSIEGTGGDAAAATTKNSNNAPGWQRGPKPKMAYQCGNLDDVLSAIQYEIQTHSQSLIPEEASCRMQLMLSAALEFPKARNASSPAAATTSSSLNKATNASIDPDPCPGYSIAASLSNFCDSKEKLKYQRVVARAIIGAVAAADGFKYTERRAVDTATSDGYRFWYVCRDSLQNKDRVANKRRAEIHEYGPDAKETFDCQGGARITFSISNLWVDVWYHHLPIHDSSFELDRVKSIQGKKEQQDMASASQPPMQNQPMLPGYAFWETPSGSIQTTPSQTNATNGSSSRKRGRSKKSSEDANPTSHGPSSSQDTRGLDTLVNAITVDLNGGASGTNPNPTAPKAKPRKKAKTQAAEQPPSSSTGVPTFNSHTAPTSPPVPPPATSSSTTSASASALATEKKRRDRDGKNRCLTCYSRRIKCDGCRPTCSGCEKGKRECSWPEVQHSQTNGKSGTREKVVKKIQSAPWQKNNQVNKKKTWKMTLISGPELPENIPEGLDFRRRAISDVSRRMGHRGDC